MFEEQGSVHTVEFEIYEVNAQPVPDLLWQNNECRNTSANGVQFVEVDQRDDDALVIVRIDNQEIAIGAWVSIGAGRLPVTPKVDAVWVWDRRFAK